MMGGCSFVGGCVALNAPDLGREKEGPMRGEADIERLTGVP